MAYEYPSAPIAVRSSSALDIGLFLAGAAFGLFLASTRSSRHMLAPPVSTTPASPPAPPGPPFPLARPSGQAGVIAPKITEWMHGAPWLSKLNLVADQMSAVVAGATLEDLRALQTKTQEASQEAYAQAFLQFSATQDQRYSRQAEAISQRDIDFNSRLAARATALIGSDISSLNNKADELNQAAQEIPGAANKIGQIDKFLNVFNQLISMV